MPYIIVKNSQEVGKYPEDDGPVRCGWRRAVLDIDAALNGKDESND